MVKHAAVPVGLVTDGKTVKTPKPSGTKPTKTPSKTITKTPSKTITKTPSKTITKTPSKTPKPSVAKTIKAMGKSLSQSPLKAILAKPAKQFSTQDDQFAREWEMFSRGDTGFLLAKGVSPHHFVDYFQNYHKRVNVFDPTSINRSADERGLVRLDSGSLLHAPSNTVMHGSVAPAPTHLIDYCRGGQVTGVVPVNNVWYTMNDKGHLLAPVGPTWLYPGQ